MARKGDGIRKRGDSWWLDFTHESKRHQVRLGRNINRTAAKEIADVQRARILRGDVGIARKKKDIKFEDATELFMESARTEKRPSTIYFYESCFARLGELFHGKRLSQITEFALERHKQRRFKQGAPTRVNKELKSLSTLYRRMIEWKRYEGPIPKTKLLPEPKGRLRFLSEDEESRLLDTSKEPHRTIWVTGIHGGLRVRSESLTLRWGSVDFVGDLLHVESGFAKNKEARPVPMNSILREALLAHHKRSKNTEAGDFVFINRKGKQFRCIRTVFTGCRTRAGLGADVVPHVLRHTFGSRLAARGVHPRAIQLLGGWKSLQMVERYTHLSQEHLADAVEKIAEKKTKTGIIPLRYSLHGKNTGFRGIWGKDQIPESPSNNW